MFFNNEVELQSLDVAFRRKVHGEVVPDTNVAKKSTKRVSLHIHRGMQLARA